MKKTIKSFPSDIIHLSPFFPSRNAEHTRAIRFIGIKKIPEKVFCKQTQPF